MGRFDPSVVDAAAALDAVLEAGERRRGRRGPVQARILDQVDRAHEAALAGDDGPYLRLVDAVRRLLRS